MRCETRCETKYETRCETRCDVVVLGVFQKQLPDEIFSIFRDILDGFFLFEIILGSGDVREGLRIAVPLEWRLTGQQDVADDPDTPHVRRVANLVIVDHFRCGELRGSEHDAVGFLGIVPASQSEVDDLDLVAVQSDAEDVLRFQIEVEDVLGVHVLDALADLPQEVDALLLSQFVIVIDHPLQQFMSADAGKTTHNGMNKQLNKHEINTKNKQTTK